ncbi:uncharacterized protein AMSG_12091, partial [Thecamonas trahens ATCC 50062]
MESPRLRKAVVPIAGLGTRMFPFTGAVAKAFLPLVDARRGHVVPFLHALLLAILNDPLSSIDQVAIVLSPAQRPMIESYFAGDAEALWAPYAAKSEAHAAAVAELAVIGSKMVLIDQPVPRGFGDAVLAAADFVAPDEYFLLCLGDHFYTSSSSTSCLAQLLAAFAAAPGPMTSVGLTPLRTAPVSGVLVAAPDAVLDATRAFDLADMLEKPSVELAASCAAIPDSLAISPPPAELSILCNFGMDILPVDVFDKLARQGQTASGECELRVGQLDILRERGTRGVLIAGDRHDTGLPHDYAASFV